jgi:hypothetical protein
MSIPKGGGGDHEHRTSNTQHRTSNVGQVQQPTNGRTGVGSRESEPRAGGGDHEHRTSNTQHRTSNVGQVQQPTNGRTGVGSRESEPSGRRNRRQHPTANFQQPTSNKGRTTGGGLTPYSDSRFPPPPVGPRFSALGLRTSALGSRPFRPPTSDLRPPTSDLRLPTSDLRLPTSIRPHSTLDTSHWPPGSGFHVPRSVFDACPPQPWRRRVGCSVFDVRRLDVGCWMCCARLSGFRVAAKRQAATWRQSR